MLDTGNHLTIMEFGMTSPLPYKVESSYETKTAARKSGGFRYGVVVPDDAGVEGVSPPVAGVIAGSWLTEGASLCGELGWLDVPPPAEPVATPGAPTTTCDVAVAGGVEVEGGIAVGGVVVAGAIAAVSTIPVVVLVSALTGVAGALSPGLLVAVFTVLLVHSPSVFTNTPLWTRTQYGLPVTSSYIVIPHGLLEEPTVN